MKQNKKPHIKHNRTLALVQFQKQNQKQIIFQKKIWFNLTELDLIKMDYIRLNNNKLE